MLRHPFKLAVFIALLVVSAYSPTADAGFIEDWDLAIVFDPDEAPTTSAGFTEPLSPFENSHFIDLLGSNASASYDFQWDGTGGTFDIATSMSIQATPTIDRRMTTGGFIFINSPVPLLISAATSFDYNVTSSPMFASLGAAVSFVETSEALAGELLTYSSTANGPQAGSFSVDFEDVLIPANETLVIQYSFLIDTDDDVPISTIATGVGSARFEIVAVPEPSAALFGMAAVTPVLLRRRRSR